MTKCPYVPPHPWNVDFPHLMLRAKAVQLRGRQGKLARQDAELDRHGRRTRRHPRRRGDRQCSQRARARARSARKVLGVDREAPVPKYHSQAARKRAEANTSAADAGQSPAGRNARQGRRVRHLLRQPQRARASAKTWSRCSSTTASASRCRQGALLRHAEARAGRSRGDREAKETNIPELEAGRRRAGTHARSCRRAC